MEKNCKAFFTDNFWYTFFLQNARKLIQTKNLENKT